MGPPLAPLLDRFGRVADDLRVSVTDRCNFRCTYCMPAEGLAWLPRSDVLAYEEIARLVGVFLDLGVRTVRLTGGEPLLRRGVETLVAMLAAQGVPDLSMTTNGDEVVDFARFARATGYQVRFIEFMPLDAEDGWRRDRVVPSEEVLEAIDRVHPLVPVDHGPEPARVFRFSDGAPGGVGVIASVSEPFCGDCNRIRITADGQFRTCLFALEETDLRRLVRAGATDDEI